MQTWKKKTCLFPRTVSYQNLQVIERIQWQQALWLGLIRPESRQLCNIVSASQSPSCTTAVCSLLHPKKFGPSWGLLFVKSSMQVFCNFICRCQRLWGLWWLLDVSNGNFRSKCFSKWWWLQLLAVNSIGRNLQLHNKSIQILRPLPAHPSAVLSWASSLSWPESIASVPFCESCRPTCVKYCTALDEKENRNQTWKEWSQWPEAR